MFDGATLFAEPTVVPDQIAIAPGELAREWSENGRHYFQYRTLKPVLNFFSVLSARYAVKRDKWNDVDLGIYYHPGHEYNLDKMMKGMKDALEYCTTNFSPYQNKTLRIVLPVVGMVSCGPVAIVAAIIWFSNIKPKITALA